MAIKNSHWSIKRKAASGAVPGRLSYGCGLADDGAYLLTDATVGFHVLPAFLAWVACGSSLMFGLMADGSGSEPDLAEGYFRVNPAGVPHVCTIGTPKRCQGLLSVAL